MRFWDASSIVPLCLSQPLTRRAHALLGEDGEIAAWWGSPVECVSAFARLRRDGDLDFDQETAARGVLRRLRDAWHEVVPGDAVREQAERLLRIHPLRAADALQLAAALQWAGESAPGDLVTFDDRLKGAAALEGFSTP